MRGDLVRIVHFSELGDRPRDAMTGHRWLLMDAVDLPHATAALMLSELEDVLVAVDHRGTTPEWGLWSRAVHLLVVDGNADAEALRLASGISKVIADDAVDLPSCLW